MPLIILLGSVWLGRKQEEEKIGEKKKKKSAWKGRKVRVKLMGHTSFLPRPTVGIKGLKCILGHEFCPKLLTCQMTD